MSLAHDEFYMENGKFVLTERFHWRRGQCCGNGCRHCPYEHSAVPLRNRAALAPPRPFFGERFVPPPTPERPAEPSETHD